MSGETINLLIGAGQLLIALLLWFGWNMQSIRDKWPNLEPTSRRSKAMLILILGGFAFTGYAAYLNRQHDCFRINRPPLETVYEKTFQNEAVDIDGKSFDHCHFENVTLHFNGTAPFAFKGTTFAGSALPSGLVTRISTNNDVVNETIWLVQMLQHVSDTGAVVIQRVDDNGHPLP